MKRIFFFSPSARSVVEYNHETQEAEFDKGGDKGRATGSRKIVATIKMPEVPLDREEFQKMVRAEANKIDPDFFKKVGIK